MAESPTDARDRIFISYRREDSAYPAGWLFDRLAERFGVEQIFKDIDSIELGDDFVEVLNKAVGSTDVLLALIGDRWLTVTDQSGNRRLEDPDDFVRLEIEAALAQKVRVIPILVEGARMPSADELPPSLAPIVRRQALELSSSRFTFDTDRLLAVLERNFATDKTEQDIAPSVQELGTDVDAVPETLEPPGPPVAPSAPPKPTEAPGWHRRLAARPRLLLALAGAVLLLVLLIGGVVLLSGSDDPAVSDPPVAGATPDDSAPDDSTSGDSLPALPENAPFAFVSDRTGASEIWGMLPGESEPRQGTFGFAEVRRGDWSPDGTRLAFASDQGNKQDDFDLWILELDGQTTRLTDSPASDAAPAWSPDGQEIAFGRRAAGEDATDIWVVDLAGGKPRQVTDDPADDDAPDWSSTNQIAFESDRDGDFDIYTLSPMGTERNVRRVTTNTWNDFFPDWSPDAKRIAYRANRDGDYDIYTIDAKGREQPQQITNNSVTDHRPSWSPDGKLIAFDSERGGQTDIYYVPWNGGVEGVLISGPDNDEAPAWGPAVG